MAEVLKFPQKQQDPLKEKRAELARLVYEHDPKLKAMGVTLKHFESFIRVTEKYLAGELTKEEMGRLAEITQPNYTQYTAKDLELLKKVDPETFGHI